MKYILYILILANNVYGQKDSLNTEYYTEKYSILSNYNGIFGNTIGLTIGKFKECKSCDGVHSKFLGLGFEIGLDKGYNYFQGIKCIYERGKNYFGIRGTIMTITSNYKDYEYLIRSELLFYPKKSKEIQIGTGFNFETLINKGLSRFDVLSLIIGYRLDLK